MVQFKSSTNKNHLAREVRTLSLHLELYLPSDFSSSVFLFKYVMFDVLNFRGSVNNFLANLRRFCL